MWQFGFPTLIPGFLLVLVPLLIHLINLLRHRRVKWAAMDFLLKSHKKHRKWIWLRQMLLLASRMAAIALLVAMLAQWKPRHSLFARFSGASAHHYVLLDDGFSMDERSGGMSAFDRGLRAIREVGERALEQDGPQRITLIRFSRAAAPMAETETAERAERIADWNAAVVDGRFESSFEEIRRRLVVSELAPSPLAALAITRRLVEADDFGTKRVYVVSDFRANPWANPAELRSSLFELETAGAQIELIHCVRQAQPNLAIVDAQPEPGPRVAGVPLFINVDIRNFGSVAARNVQLKVRTRFFDESLATSAAPGQFEGEVEELPVDLLESIAPGDIVRRRVQVFFPSPGRHVVEAVLPEDPIAADNRRWCVIDFRSGEPVLVIDGDPERRNAFYLESIFQPGPNARTGIEPVIQDGAFLRDAPAEDLERFATVYLLDVGKLEGRAVERLEAFVSGGGGLAFFLGPRTDRAFVNEWLYRDGKGVFPLPIEEQDLLPPTEEEEPDVNVEGSEHPVFRDLLAGRNPLIRLIHVDRYFAPPPDWRPSGTSTAQVIASLRNRDPLMIERPFGDGRVIATLSTYAPIWNDLALGPNALLALQLQAYLAQGRRRFETRRVGSPVRVEWNLDAFRPDVKFVLPGTSGMPKRTLDRRLEPIEGGSKIGRATVGASPDPQGFPGETERAGVMESWASGLAGATEIRRFALNVDPLESDPTLADMRKLIGDLNPVRADWRYADQSQFDALTAANLPPNLLLLVMLLGLMVSEQALAYAAGYHPPRGGSR
ncbi:MAG: hypothetical protein FJ297_04925 [Planctomycetes bacterium]|nr:hypothetical protein [Planctomycetota bacterium]